MERSTERSYQWVESKNAWKSKKGIGSKDQLRLNKNLKLADRRHQYVGESKNWIGRKREGCGPYQKNPES